MIPFLPSYIPPEIDMTHVKADVSDDGVSVPPAEASDVPALRQVVARREPGLARADDDRLDALAHFAPPPTEPSTLTGRGGSERAATRVQEHARQTAAAQI